MAEPAAQRASAGTQAPSRRLAIQALGVIAGVILALAAAELSLRPFSTALTDTWAPIGEDEPTDLRVIEVRQYFEDITTTHFSPSHARLTGNRWLGTAPVAVLVGDSYIEAQHVDDADTIGSQLETLFRSHGEPMNIRQYGWPGANPATYVGLAPTIIGRWPDANVIVVLNSGDLGRSAFEEGDRFVRDSGGRVTAQLRDVGALLRRPKTTEAALRSSTLAYLVGRLVHEVREAHAAARRPDEAPASHAFDETEREQITIEVQQLKAAFGERLLLAYVPNTGGRGLSSDVVKERQFLSECESQRVRCLSSRESLETAVHEARLVRGFTNTAPGFGHTNALGNALIARDVWRRLSSAPNGQ